MQDDMKQDYTGTQGVKYKPNYSKYKETNQKNTLKEKRKKTNDLYKQNNKIFPRPTDPDKN